MRFAKLAAVLLVGLGLRQIYIITHPSDPSVVDQPHDVAVVGVAEEIAQFISDNPVMVFSKSYCGYSKRAKHILSRHLGEGGFAVVELDERADGDEMQDELLKLTGGRTVPRVFIDGKFVGGADDLTKLHEQGKLSEMLQAVASA